MAEFTLGFVLATLSCLVLATVYKMADNHKRKCAQSKWEEFVEIRREIHRQGE
jgi:hypothetical protein